MKKKILAGVSGVVGVAIVAALGTVTTLQQNELKSLRETASKEANQIEAENNEAEKVVVAKKAYESKYFNVKFEYPESWTLREKSDVNRDDEYGNKFRSEGVELVKDGKIIKFVMGNGLGVGGIICQDEYMREFQFNMEKAADTKISGLAVAYIAPVPYGDYAVDEHITEQFRVVSGDEFGDLNYCQKADGRLNRILESRHEVGFRVEDSADPTPIFSMQYVGNRDNLSEESKKEIIEILSSISLK